jgi:hypothetical protein
MQDAATVAVRRGPRTRWMPGIAALLLVALGCASVHMAAYDPEIEKAVVELQPEMDRLLTKYAGLPTLGNEQFADLLEDYSIRVRSVLVRAKSQPLNDETIEQLQLVLDSVEQLRALREAGPIEPEVCSSLRDLFNQGWTAVLTLELAKRRG